MKRGNKELKASRLDSISQKYVADDDLLDTPAILYRKIIKALQMNPRKWANYLREYLDWVVTTEDPIKAKSDRITRAGNIKDTYFQKKTLTFNKLLEGLSILQMRNCTIRLTIEDRDGNIHVVEESTQIMTKERLERLVNSSDNTKD